VAKPPAPVKEPAPQEKDDEEADTGGFWSDGDDEAPKIGGKLPVIDDDDDATLAPNPLVTGRARAVDLQASIKSTTEALGEQQKKEAMLRDQATIVTVEAEEPDSEDDEEPPPPEGDTEYGDLDRVTPKERPKFEPRKVIKRQRVPRTRRRGGATGGDDGQDGGDE
jgi:hypothetical protein